MPNGLFVIADVGANWKRYLDTPANKQAALKQIDGAKASGCDAVKFQLFTHDELYGFPGDNTYSLPREWIASLARHCEAVGIEFMCSAFSPDGVEFLNPFVKRHKLASAEFKHVGLWHAILVSEKPIIASTGCAHDLEITAFVNKYGSKNVTLLECVGAYPASPSDYRLYALSEWRRQWPGIDVGISDHTTCGTPSLLSVPFGATVFERHFDLFKGELSDTPDSPVSVSPEEMCAFIEGLKRVQVTSFGRTKRPARVEDDMQTTYRRRLIATQDIYVGERLEMGRNFGIFRSKTPDYRGAPPEQWQLFDGKNARIEIKQGQSLWHEDVCQK
jgi:N-acetylneuraminate synthase